MLFRDASCGDGGTPSVVDTRGVFRSSQFVVTITGELDTRRMPDVSDVLTVLELSNHSDDQDLSMVECSRKRTDRFPQNK